jgi:hypothetical protein
MGVRVKARIAVRQRLRNPLPALAVLPFGSPGIGFNVINEVLFTISVSTA